MGKVFYDHLVAFEEIHAELGKYDLTIEEREEIISLSDQHLHHSVIYVILKSLPTDKHKSFLEDFYKSPHSPDLLKYLNNEAQKEIKKLAKLIKEDIVKEIRRSAKK